VITRRTRIKATELRVSTAPDDCGARDRGLFWEDYKIHENADWLYKSGDAGFQSDRTAHGRHHEQPFCPGCQRCDSSTTSPVVYSQKAVFTSVDST